MCIRDSSNMNTEFLPSVLPLTFLKAVLFVLLVGKPTNIAFRILFGKFQPETSLELDTIDGAGAMIGFLERLVKMCIRDRHQAEMAALSVREGSKYISS